MLCPAAAFHLMLSSTEFTVSNDNVNTVSEYNGKWLCVFIQDRKSLHQLAWNIMLTNIYPHPTFCNLHQSAFVAESEPEMWWLWMQSLDFGQVHFKTFLGFSAVLLAFMPHMISRASTVSARRECKHASSFKKKKKQPRKFKSSSEALERSRITVKQCLHKVFQETIIKPLWCVSC